MKKFKEFADKFQRPERSEVLPEKLQEAEKRVELIKGTCESIRKKVQACLRDEGKSALDKRTKKVPEFMLGSEMVTYGNLMGDNSVLGTVLSKGGAIEMKLGQAVVDFEIKIEECVLKPIQIILDNDIANIHKQKRNLNKLSETMDSLKMKHEQSKTAGKVDNTKEDWEDAQKKVEQCRDKLAAEMYALLARETEISRHFVTFLNCQKEYHRTVHAILTEQIPGVEAALSSNPFRG